jgi:hypothetical protein
MPMRDLALDGSGDVYLAPDGDIATLQSTDVVSIVQHVKQRLQLFRGEWFLAPSEGLPYFQVVLVKSPNPNAVRAAFIEVIEGTPGITKVDRLDLLVDTANRRLQVGWSAGTDLGEVAADVLSIAS